MRFRGGGFTPPSEWRTPAAPGHDYYGKGPVQDGRAAGPFGYVGSERDSRGEAEGWSAGFGLLSGPIGPGTRADVLQAQGHYGAWADENGTRTVGIAGDAGLVKFGMEPGQGGGLGPIGFDVGVMTANAGITHNENTTSVGAQANIIEGAISAGNQEHNMRIGGSVGVGLAGRLHHGDADGDGVNEMGFGFDFGPVSFDMRTEALGHAYNAVTDW
ncbi:MAG: hypothetical protein ACKV2T_19020 [Kofleriaceae bacterium]